jgi:hypothetical protein
MDRLPVITLRHLAINEQKFIGLLIKVFCYISDHSGRVDDYLLIWPTSVRLP